MLLEASYVIHSVNMQAPFYNKRSLHTSPRDIMFVLDKKKNIQYSVTTQNVQIHVKNSGVQFKK